jgi:hypothetical protein
VGSIHVKVLPNNNFEVTSSSKYKLDAQDKTNSIQIKVQQCVKVPNAKKALLKAPRKYAHETRKLRRC